MPAWMEKIKDTFTAKADLKSLFIVLQPDNQVSTVMVVSYVPTDKDSFQVFMDLTARIAMDQKTIPDNLLLHFEGIPAKDIPFTSKLPVKDSEKALRFIVSHGGITENNSVPLRKAAYLRACQKELTAETLISEVMKLKNNPALTAAMGQASRACAPVKALDIIYDTISSTLAQRQR